jgi:hypothetical protein
MPLSPTILNIHINEMLVHHNQIYSNRTEVNDITIISKLFAYDQLLVTDSEDDSQVCTNHTKQFGMKISSLKYEVIAYKVQLQ